VSFSLSEYTKIKVGWGFSGGDKMGEEGRAIGK